MMKTESTPPKDPPTPPSATTKAASMSPTAVTTALTDDAPRAKKAGVGPVRTRAAPTGVNISLAMFGQSHYIYLFATAPVPAVLDIHPIPLKHTGERPFACHCGKQFSRLDNLRQHAQTVHSDKTDLNERMMRDLTSLHTALAASSHRNLPRLSPSQATTSQGSRSQPSTPNDSHPPSAALSGRPILSAPTPYNPVDLSPSHSSYAPLSDNRFQPTAHDFHPHPSGRDSIGRFPSSNSAHANGSFERSHPGRDGFDRSPLDRLDPRDRSVDDGGGSKPFTSGGSAGGGLPPISSLIPESSTHNPYFPPIPQDQPPQVASPVGALHPDLSDACHIGRQLAPAPRWTPGLTARPATAAAPLGFGPSAPSSRPGTSGGIGSIDRGGDVFAFEPPALASSRYDDGDGDDRSPRDRDGDGLPRSFGLPFGLRPGTAPAASFDRAGRSREWERERPWFGRDQSSERRSRHELRRDERDYGSRRHEHSTDNWNTERLASRDASPSSDRSPNPSMESRRRGSGGLYPGEPDREVGLLSPNGGGYDSPFSYHPPGLAPRKRSYDFGPGDAAGPDSRPSSRRLTLMELCSAESSPDDHAAGTPLGVSTHGKSPVERGREPPPLIRPATIGGGDGGGLPGIASFSYRNQPDTIYERTGTLSLGPTAASTIGTTLRDTDGRGDSLPPPPSPPPTAMGLRDDDGERERQRERLFERRDATAPRACDEFNDGYQRGAGVSDPAVGPSSTASHWRERERLRGQVRTPISPPPTATGVRAGSAS
ncbi:Zinc finger, C2H2 type [Rhizoctonia solani]|uniref:Zinc finger, C2H2 type n=1 Tax=Rhizoctonia solani TaxID=456999 RepID=A0A8H7M8V5_9AGAM|nr:Zinc finger, C2H2 type [Rhizoctonia solani]